MTLSRFQYYMEMGPECTMYSDRYAKGGIRDRLALAAVMDAVYA
jgi:hypothetical protein